MTVIGGPLGFLGPVIGSVIYTFLFAFVSGFTEYWPLTIGLIVIFVVLYMPGGVLGLAGTKFRKIGAEDAGIDADEPAEEPIDTEAF
jgi:branched-chain amino acid transport system permease protein